jgi:hypothetical protein
MCRFGQGHAREAGESVRNGTGFARVGDWISGTTATAAAAA